MPIPIIINLSKQPTIRRQLEYLHRLISTKNHGLAQDRLDLLTANLYFFKDIECKDKMEEPKGEGVEIFNPYGFDVTMRLYRRWKSKDLKLKWKY
jgi:hypothetical protein